jgi:hypothetical protein
MAEGKFYEKSTEQCMYGDSNGISNSATISERKYVYALTE